ncbi:MAG: hypothetical protein IVW55_07420 [Chloroflexi bacterium]|nr:hypothetical protein [Chloroflexota bacterium]
MVKKGEEQVSSIDSPKHGDERDPNAPKIKHKGGTKSQTRAMPQARVAGEGSNKG